MKPRVVWGRAVGALEVIEEMEPSDPEEDDECDYVAGGDFEREEGRHRGRLEELKKMQEFKLYDVVPRQEALEKGWRVLKFRWVDKERPEIWRCRYVVKDFRALQPWRRDLFTPSSLPITNRIVDAVAESQRLGSVGCGCNECVLSCCRGRRRLW